MVGRLCGLCTKDYISKVYMTIKFDKERMDILSQGIDDNQVEEERQIHRGQKI
jgi:hypothetical protein